MLVSSIDLVDRHAEPIGVADVPEALGDWDLASFGVTIVDAVLLARRPRSTLRLEAEGPISSERIAFCNDSLNVRPIAIASPTDFICVSSRSSAWGNFSKAKRGILVTT